MNVSGEEKKETAPAKTKPPVKHEDTIGNLINKLKPQLQKALPKHVTAERLARVALTAVRVNPKLGLCNQASLLGAIMTSASLGLEPNTPLGEAYLIPYKAEAQFQLGYKGLLKLAHNSGQYKQITANAVDEADEFSYSYGLNPDLKHIPADKPSGNIVRYYAVYHLVNGGFDFKVWSRDKAEAHGKQYSKSYSSGPWKTNFDQMAMKSVLIELLKMAPKSIELSNAVASDNMTFNVNQNDPDLNIDTVQTDFEVED